MPERARLRKVHHRGLILPNGSGETMATLEPKMTLGIPLVPLTALCWTSLLACAQPLAGTDSALGQQLYSTHCDSCHTSQVHWRDKRIAKDWKGLVAQVRRWQSNTGLQWSDAEILEVAGYLNARYYHFEEKRKQASVAPLRVD
jgi:mono/diheme cytochrome c family protein